MTCKKKKNSRKAVIYNDGARYIYGKVTLSETEVLQDIVSFFIERLH